MHRERCEKKRGGRRRGSIREKAVPQAADKNWDRKKLTKETREDLPDYTAFSKAD